MQPGYLIPIFGENDFDFYSGFNREPVKRSQCWGGRNGHIMFKMIIQHCNCIWVMINSEQHSRISVGDKKLYIPICFYSRCMTQPTQWNKPWGRMKKVGGKKDSGDRLRGGKEGWTHAGSVMASEKPIQAVTWMPCHQRPRWGGNFMVRQHDLLWPFRIIRNRRNLSMRIQ